MILADKIINERKKNGWSQEELAEMLSVSRQSVSKWEGAQAVPDLNRIIQMAELFGVTTDYLLKDEIEDPGNSVSDSADESQSLRKVSLEDASRYINTVAKNTPSAIVATVLFVLCAAPLILLAGLSVFFENIMSQNTAVLIGLITLFAAIAVGVLLWIMIESREKEFEFLKKEDFETLYGVSGMVKEKKTLFDKKRTILNSIAVMLFILSPVGVITAALTGSSNMSIILCVDLILIMVAVGVGIVLYTSRIGGSYDLLLGEGKLSKSERRINKKMDAFNGIYWCLVVAGFMFAGLGFGKWNLAGVIFPIAGVLYAAVYGITKMLITKDED